MNIEVGKIYYNDDNSTKELGKVLKPATPSVIRRGLCVLRNEGDRENKAMKDFTEKNKGLVDKASKTAEFAIKYGLEVANSCDPLSAAIAVGGKSGVGALLSKFSASQCAGIVGVIVSSITPQASVPLLLKKINEDLAYLKKSIDIVRENPQYMANEFLSRALQKLQTYQFDEALKLFEKCEYEATRGIHMAPTFRGVLSCVQMSVFSRVMIECASNLESIPCFVPLHCLTSKTKHTVQRIITEGLSTITNKAESKKWNGKRTITSKMQNVIDPFLAALYNTYSLSAGLTDPYKDGTLAVPDTVRFKIDITFISEGEEDSCKLEVLLHDDLEIVVYAWKEFRRYGHFVCLRYEKTTWNVCIKNGNRLQIEYNILENEMSTTAGKMNKIVGWPKQRMSVSKMIEEVSLNKTRKLKTLSKSTYKWIRKVPSQYLDAMNVNLDEVTKDGNTLLHVLADLKDSKYVKWVIDKIRNVDQYDSFGQTPLHRACAASNLKVAKLLLQHGANVNAVRRNGDTPLMVLLGHQKQDSSFIKMLLDFNARRDIENNDNMRAVDLARITNSTDDVIELLHPI